MTAARSPYAADGSLRFGATFLVDHFRVFHADLLALRDDAERSSAGIRSDEDSGDAADPTVAICLKLAQRLEHDSGEAQRLGGGLGIRLYREAAFVMAALADEILLHGPIWVGQQRWSTTLLESRMYKTYDAGERFFQKLDALLAARDPVETQLGAVYLFALKLGFQGKYRGEADCAATLDMYRHRLFEFIANRSPDVGRHAWQVTPDAYEHTLSARKQQFLPFVWGWTGGLVGFLLLFLLVSHLTWLSQIRPVLAIISVTP